MSNLETIAVIDAGGRGAALVDGYGKSEKTAKIIVVPGNDLMALNLPSVVAFSRRPFELKAQNRGKIVDTLRGQATLVDVCQDDMVECGLVDALSAAHIPVVGPVREAGRIEWDKPWARQFMKEEGIAHPAFHVFDNEEAGIAFVRAHPETQWVIKAAGLALGKGVEVASNTDEAVEGIKKIQKYGKTYVIEERLFGEEFSFYAVCDGDDYKMMAGAQDHKRLRDGDEGPNTGGMGCVSNPLILTPDILSQVDDILAKTFDGMRKRKHPYRGVIYIGGIVCDGKVKVIEFNARWGDPEAEVIVPGMRTDLLEVSRAVTEKRVRNLRIDMDTKVRVAVALASAGYPDTSTKGKEIFGIDTAAARQGVTIYGAGVRMDEARRVFTNGGRVLYVVGEGGNVIEARKVAYDAMDCITVEDGAGQFRKDIGMRDVERLMKA